MGDQLVKFFESTFVQQEVDAFAGGEFPFAMLPFTAFGAAPFFSGLMAAAEFVKAGHRFNCSGGA